MAISADYITLQRAVADELGGRTDLLSPLSDSNLTLSPIQNAIQSAVAKWEREPFYFNEGYEQALFSTVPGTEFYATPALIATAPRIMQIHILVNANRYTLNVRNWQYLEDISNSPAVTGMPTDYAYFQELLRFYPIPNGAYPLTLSVTARQSALAADGDANCWTQDAYDLIRSEAKLILAREVLFDDEISARMQMAIYGNPQVRQDRGYLYALKAESTRRAKSRITPSQF